MIIIIKRSDQKLISLVFFTIDKNGPMKEKKYTTKGGNRTLHEPSRIRLKPSA